MLSRDNYHLDEIAQRWAALQVDSYTALEMSKELMVRLLDKGEVVAMPAWVEGLGLHSVLIIGHSKGPAGHWFEAINRDPFTPNPVRNFYDLDVLGYRRWNVPVRVYGRAS